MKGKIVTLDGTSRWYLADETVQNNTKYYLGLEIDEKVNEPKEDAKSCIFKEEKEGQDIYLTEETDNEVLKYLSAVFVSSYAKYLD